MTLSVGNVRFAYVLVRDAEGVLAESDDVALDVLKPDQTTDSPDVAEATETQLDLVNADNARNPDWTVLTDTTGVYCAEIELDQDGNWWGRWSATDPLALVEQFAFYVYPQRVVIVVP